MEERDSERMESRVPQNGENKENQEKNNNGTCYPHLAYENFKHTGLGLETYMDGVQHPLELRRILVGDLSQEMSVSYRLSGEDKFQKLIHPNYELQQKSGVEIYDSSGRAVSSFPTLPKPPKLIKAGSIGVETAFPGGLWESDQPSPESVQDDDEMRQIVAPRKPGRPPAQQGTFDPESGTIRYICRLHCGASLASAKGRRKHEKKHCPNVPKEHFGGFPMYYSTSNIVGHSLFGGGRIPVKKQEWFECRLCGKVLKTYEGRRLHEKLQHLPNKKNPAINKTFQANGGSLTPVDASAETGIEGGVDPMEASEAGDGEAGVEYEDLAGSIAAGGELEDQEDDEDDEVEDDLEDEY